MMDHLPLLQRHGAVASLSLRRPLQRNRLHDEDLFTLLRQFDEVEADQSIRVLVLKAETTGQPRPVFCAGYNVNDFEAGHHDPRLFESIPDRLEALRPITVCALNGSVYGGATDLALACDLRVGLAGCEFLMPACALGLHYYPSGLRRFVSRLGAGLAQKAFLTAAPLPFDALYQAHALTALHDAEHFEAGLQDLLDRVARLAPLAVQACKQSLRELIAGGADEATLRCREALTLASADFAEGRRAFSERRPARFTGQ